MFSRLSCSARSRSRVLLKPSRNSALAFSRRSFSDCRCSVVCMLRWSRCVVVFVICTCLFLRVSTSNFHCRCASASWACTLFSVTCSSFLCVISLESWLLRYCRSLSSRRNMASLFCRPDSRDMRSSCLSRNSSTWRRSPSFSFFIAAWWARALAVAAFAASSRCFDSDPSWNES